MIAEQRQEPVAWWEDGPGPWGDGGGVVEFIFVGLSMRDCSRFVEDEVESNSELTGCDQQFER